MRDRAQTDSGNGSAATELQHAPAVGRALADSWLSGIPTSTSRRFLTRDICAAGHCESTSHLGEVVCCTRRSAGRRAARPRTLIDALMRAFQRDYQVPDRQHYAVAALESQGHLARHARLPRGGCLGVKLGHGFSGNGLRGNRRSMRIRPVRRRHRSAAGRDYGTELTRRRPLRASALAARYLAAADAPGS